MVRLRGVVTPFPAKGQRDPGPVSAADRGHDRGGHAAVAGQDEAHDAEHQTGPPLQSGPRRRRLARPLRALRPGQGIPDRLHGGGILVAGLAVLFGSPDDTPVTVKSWSNADAVDFAETAITELDGTSGTATYGPPYNLNGTTAGKLGPINPAHWLGVHHPIDTANDYVLGPLSTLPNSPGPGGSRRVQVGPGRSAGDLDGRLREGGGRRQVRRTAS